MVGAGPPSRQRHQQLHRNHNRRHSGHRHRPQRYRSTGGSSEISCCVKYTVFGFNVVFWVIGFLFLAIGTWAQIEKTNPYYQVKQLSKFYLDPSWMIIMVGAVTFIIGFSGCVGALRENTCFLAGYSALLGLLVLAEGLVVIIVLMSRDWLETEMRTKFDDMIVLYRDDPDLQSFIDWMQSEWKCCGINKPDDWDMNIYFNSSARHLKSVEAGGVPFSCCVDTKQLANYECGYRARSELRKQMGNLIYTEGCLPKLLQWLNSNLLYVGTAIFIIAIVQMASAMRRKCKAFFAEYQDYLSGGVKLSEYEEQEVRWRRISFASYVMLILFVGLPIWWLTTTPYRATLPYFDEEAIDRLRNISAPHLRLHEHGNEAGVWGRMPQFPNYQLHVVFIHGNGWDRRHGGASTEEGLMRHLNRFSEAIEGSIHLDITTEHLFDFDYLDTSSNSGKYVTVGTSNVSRLASEIDRLTTPPAGYAPLLKLATFLDDGSRPQRMRLVDSDRANTHELIVAGWGGVLAEPHRSSVSINWLKASSQAVLSTMMGISRDGHRSDGTRMSSGGVKELHDRHSRDLWAENLNQTAHFINSLHELKEKITDMVISDEVAEMAWTSHTYFFSALDSFISEGKIDSIASAKARILSSRAVTHSSLLEYLNFPHDQKYGVYVPLFVPLIMQIAFPIFGLAYFALNYRRRRRALKND